MKQEIKERIEKIRRGEVPEGYKKTKIGIIPDDWDVCDLIKYCSKISDGIHTTPEYCQRSNYYFINGNNLKNGSIIITDSTKCVTKEEYKKNCKDLNENSILMSINGTIGEVAFFKNEKVILGKSAAYINCIYNEDINFVYYNLQTQKTINFFLSELTGSTIKNLSLKSLKETPIPSPPVATEREKIASILSTWDKAIELKEKLIEQKKELKRGLMQKLLTGEIRFPEFGDKWENYLLDEIVKRVTRKNEENNENVVTISAKNGFVNQGDYFSKIVASKDLKGYYLLKEGEFAYNKSYSNGYPIGVIKRLKNHEKAVVTTLYICFCIKNKKVLPDFLENLLSSELINKQVKKIAPEGGRDHGLLNVRPTDFFKIKVKIPQIEEQKRIVNVLSSMDKEIELRENELQYLKQQKKGLMQLLLTGIVRVNTGENNESSNR
ncbi:MAG: restriction endonuclease subunit S [Bacteroidota bacterium]